MFWGEDDCGGKYADVVFVLVSGIVIWCPRTGKALKNSLKITVGKGWRRFWYNLHVAGGMYALVLLLAMALTGLTWSFPWYRAGFYKVFGVERNKGQDMVHRKRLMEPSPGINLPTKAGNISLHTFAGSRYMRN